MRDQFPGLRPSLRCLLWGILLGLGWLALGRPVFAAGSLEPYPMAGRRLDFLSASVETGSATLCAHEKIGLRLFAPVEMTNNEWGERLGRPSGVSLRVGLAQEGESAGTTLVVDGVDQSDFPALDVLVTARWADGSPREDVSGLALLEDGRPITDFSVAPVVLPLDVMMVLDGNAASAVIDEAGGTPRWQIALNSMTRFTTRSLEPGDSVSVLVPTTGGGRFLVEKSEDPVALQAALADYTPEPLEVTPLQAMLLQAIEGVSGAREAGRIPLILLYTDGASLDEQLDFEQLVAAAQGAGVRIYAAIQGRRADPEEVTNVALLYEPTGGFFLHLPDAASGDPFFTDWRAGARRHRISYRSRAAVSGVHSVAVELDGASAGGEFVVTVLPAAVTPLAGETTIRLAATGESGATTRHPLLWEVQWPDGYPRRLETVELIVDGQAQAAARAPTLSGDVLTVDWGIESSGEGAYALQVRLVDELGLETISERVAMTIELGEVEATEAPLEAAVAPTAVPDPTPAPPAVATGTIERWGAVGAGLAALGGLLLLWRRRRAAQPEPVVGEDGPNAFQDAVAVAPAAATAPETLPEPSPPVAWLKLPAADGEEERLVPLHGDRWLLGSDAAADVVVTGSGVAERHARIARQAERFFLADEGSGSGTYLNFERLGLAPRELTEGDEVHLGAVRLGFFLQRRR